MICIKQPDSTLKSTSIKVKFGSFKVFNPNEKEVEIYVNGEKRDLKLRLSQNGDIYIPEEYKKKVPLNDKIDNKLDRRSSFDDSDSNLSVAGDSVYSKNESPLIKIKNEDDLIENLSLRVPDNYISMSDIKSESHLNMQNFNEKICQKQLLFFEDNDYRNLKQDYPPIVDSQNSIQNTNLTDNKNNFSFVSESFNFVIAKESDFMIENSINKLSIEMSNCWQSVQTTKTTQEEEFYKNIITEEEFFKDPWTVLNSKNLALKVKDSLYNWKAIAPIIIAQLAFGKTLPEDILAKLTEEEKGFLGKLFGSKIKNTNVVRLNSPSKRKTSLDNKSNFKAEASKVMLITKTYYKKVYELSSKQLEALKLKDGKNDIVFKTKSRIQGEQAQKVDMYMWDYDAKIVISDVDGTITRSDFLGHVLPLFGKDWTHKGVVELFDNIVKQGYKMLYLSARSLAQAKSTKTFLKTIVQDNIVLPDGPVMVSPDGLMTSFKREVIDRTPQIFKVSCLFEIVNLFPNEELPFYAGFGNRITDSFSYKQVGIKEGRIFTINEKGLITQKNNKIITTYNNISEIKDLIFPYIKGNNIFSSNFDHFKPKLTTNVDINELFK